MGIIYSRSARAATSLLSTTMPPTLKRADLDCIAKDTLARTKELIKQYAPLGASSSSQFISSQLPPLPSPSSNAETPRTVYTIANVDSFTAARKMIAEDAGATGKTAVLNLASDERPAGGWLFSLSKTQEEALCYSSTLYTTLKESESYYPWPNTGPGSVAGVYSPGVVVFKDDLDHGCVDLPEEEVRIVSVLTVAAPRWPKLTKDGLSFEDPSVLENLRGKIRLVYRMAASNGKEYIVLGAMGCGAYACPAHLVAAEMKSILLEDEFKNAFQRVVLAIYSKASTGDTNYTVFKDVFEDILSSS